MSKILDTDPVLSASQIATWTDCERKWGHRYLDGKKEPPSPAAALGTAGHSVLEKYLKFAEMPNTLHAVHIGGKEHFPGQMVVNMLPILPVPPRPESNVEHSFTLELPSARFRGFIDNLEPPPFQPWPTVFDHKSTSNLRYAKTPDDLLTDAQGMLYAKYALDYFDPYGTGKVELRWNYFLTKSPHKVRPVWLTTHKGHVETQIERIDVIASQMIRAHREGLKAKDMRPNPSSCPKYGGCPHKSYCTLTNEERMTAYMTTTTLRETLLGSAGAPPAPPAPPSLSGLEAAAADGWQIHPQYPEFWFRGQVCKSKADVEALYPAPVAAPPPPPAPAINPPESTLPPAPPKSTYMPTEPEDAEPAAPLPGPAKLGAVTEIQDEFTSMVREDLKALALKWGVSISPKARDNSIRDALRAHKVAVGMAAGAIPAPAPAPVASPSLEQIQAELDARRASAPPSVAPPAPPAPPAVPVPPPAPEKKPYEPPAVVSTQKAPTDGFTLYVDCFPVKGGDAPVSFDQAFGFVLAEVAKANNAIHYKEIGYGKGPGLVVTAIRDLGTSAPAIVISAESAEGRDFLETLIGMAGSVVRAFR